MIILSHPTGNANVRAACQGFLKAGLLTEFNTSIAFFPDKFLDRLSKYGSLSELKRRQLESDFYPYTRTWPWLELCRLISSKLSLTPLTKHEIGPCSIDAVYRSCDRHVASGLHRAAKRGAKIVYAYEDGAAFSFMEAKKNSMICIYDLPIGYWRTARHLLDVERENWPQWASTLTGFSDSLVKLARKDEELKLADHIFVASKFTAKSLSDYPGNLAPISIIPYGFPAVTDIRSYNRIQSRRLKLLFVGGLTQRKGIANLFAAIEGLENFVELTVVGQKVTDDCVPLNMALAKHHWIPSLSHHDILAIMREHDVLVFPSLFEGFGLVITEAMSQGTPVITTERTAGPDLITDGENGWITKAGSTEGLRQTIETLLIKPDRVAEAGEAAKQTARLRPWSVYGHELAEKVAQINCSIVPGL